MSSTPIYTINRVANFGDLIVVEFSDGKTARFGTDFLMRYRELEGNALVQETPSDNTPNPDSQT